MKSLLPLVLSSLLLVACAATPPDNGEQRLAQAPFLLLGEVHDNAEQHGQRAALLTRMLADGRPTTVVFEQLGRAQDPTLATAPRETQALIEAGKLDQNGWRWPLHKQLIDAALAGGARIVGGNLEREEVRRIVRDGAAALPADVAALQARTPWSEAQQALLIQSIDEGHCGAMPAAMHGPMALAQRARDAAMAQAMLNARAAGSQRIALLAGNGHVRRDLAVPLYLQAAGVPAADIVSQAYLETDESGASTGHDMVVRTVAAPREDPCKAFKRDTAKP
jgi:uncharacterized iron-regulated protein